MFGFTRHFGLIFVLGLWITEGSEQLRASKSTAEKPLLEAIADKDAPVLLEVNMHENGTKEQCCHCTDGAVGWSSTGDCGLCTGSSTLMKLDVSGDCIQEDAANFKGAEACANRCKTTNLLHSISAGKTAAMQNMTEPNCALIYCSELCCRAPQSSVSICCGAHSQ